MDEDRGGTCGGGITAVERDDPAFCEGVFVEDGPADTAAAVLQFQQSDAIDARCLPQQAMFAAVLPIAAKARVERTGLTLDLHVPGDPDRCVLRELTSAGAQDPAAPVVDAEVSVNDPTSALVRVAAFCPFEGDGPEVIIQSAEDALGHAVPIVVSSCLPSSTTPAFSQRRITVVNTGTRANSAA